MYIVTRDLLKSYGTQLCDRNLTTAIASIIKYKNSEKNIISTASIVRWEDLLIDYQLKGFLGNPLSIAIEDCEVSDNCNNATTVLGWKNIATYIVIGLFIIIIVEVIVLLGYKCYKKKNLRNKNHNELPLSQVST